jgi:hypothetical protein
MVWLFNNTGKSVFGMALFHMTINVTWLLFPVSGSFFDPRVTGLILAAIAASVVMVWGPGMQGRRQRTSQALTEIETSHELEKPGFLYLLLNNQKLRDVIDTIAKKAVLILGRFTLRRKAILDVKREALRTHAYVPILFDFDKPASRDLTE